MSKGQKKQLTVLGIIVAIVFVVFIWPHTHKYDGDGSINVFPSGDSIKNYRLSANIKVAVRSNGWQKSAHTYSDIIGYWPNGGTLDLTGCEVHDIERATCIDQAGKVYGVEVSEAPSRPDTSDPADY